ncbi:MAG: hypothetical protein PHX07_02095 [Candidatus Marinimicrobia bacterium]|jgi:hypothetical protein|nr:hypothetical protein [Candidatus Neomarinimicrobiota bacterium]
MTNKPQDKIPCEVCKKAFSPYRLKMHQTLTHPDLFAPLAEMADMKAKLADTESRLAELQQNKTEPEMDSNAILADWIEALTPEAWELIGKERGFMADVPQVATTTIPDDPPNSTIPQKKVLFLSHGVVVTKGG